VARSATKRSVLIARHRATQAQRQISDTLGSLPEFDSTSELARMERRIRMEESKTEALSEMQRDDSEWQFMELDRDGEIESELAALKARNDPEHKSIESGEDEA